MYTDVQMKYVSRADGLRRTMGVWFKPFILCREMHGKRAIYAAEYGN